jgi:hypothetical protein
VRRASNDVIRLIALGRKDLLHIDNQNAVQSGRHRVRDRDLVRLNIPLANYLNDENPNHWRCRIYRQPSRGTFSSARRCASVG